MPDIRIDNRGKALAAVLAAGAVLAVIFVRRPVPGAYPVCIFHSLTGLYCPGCGSLRATYQLLHGHLRAAFDLNPLFVVMLPVLAYAPASWLRLLLTGKSLPEFSPPARATWSILFVIAAFWIARNVPVYPFTQLAP